MLTSLEYVIISLGFIKLDREDNMENNNKSYIKASFWERLAAMIIDDIIFIIPSLTFLFAISISSPDFFKNTENSIGQLWIPLLNLIYILYNIGLVTWKGATLGKMALKLKVVTTSYERIPLGKAVLRETIGKWSSSLILSLGNLWVLIDKKHQSWHDKIAGTLVVKVDNAGQLISGEDTPITTKAKALFIAILFVFSIPIFLAIFVIFYLLIAQPNQIKGRGMAPNYIEGRYYIVNKIAYRVYSPERGEVILFQLPRNPEYQVVYRVIGLPSEKLKIENGKVYINEEPLLESYLPSGTYTRGGNFIQEGVSTVIPENNYFVLGDNRDHSSDSREWGFVPRENIIGKFWFRYH